MSYVTLLTHRILPVLTHTGKVLAPNEDDQLVVRTLRTDISLVWEKPCKHKSNVLLKTTIWNAVWNIHNLSNIISWFQSIIKPLKDCNGFYKPSLMWPKCWLLLEKQILPSPSPHYTPMASTELNEGTDEYRSFSRSLGWKAEKQEGRASQLQLHDFQHTIRCKKKVWACLPATSPISQKKSWNHNQRKPRWGELSAQHCYNHMVHCPASLLVTSAPEVRFQPNITEQVDSLR